MYIILSSSLYQHRQKINQTEHHFFLRKYGNAQNCRIKRLKNVIRERYIKSNEQKTILNIQHPSKNFNKKIEFLRTRL